MRRTLALALLGLAAPALASDREAFAEGVRLLRAGQPKEALIRLKAAEKSFAKDDLPASLLADLAVAAWQAGELGEAESYAERAAARDGALDFLRDTIVGGVRLEEARQAAADPQGLAAAKEKAERAVAAFEHALGGRDSEEAQRNLERALKELAEIEEKLKQQEQQKKDDQQKQDDKKEQDKQDDQKDQDKQDQQKKDEQDKKDEQQQQKPDEKKGDEKKPEQEQPQPENKEQEQPKPGEKQDQKDEKKSDPQQAQQQPGDQKPEGKPGKDDKPRLVSPEEAARLQRLLEEIEKDKKELRLKLQPRHTPGKKDW